MNVSASLEVLSNPLASELVWNILDNATKENGYPKITDVDESVKESVVLVIVPFAGGMLEDMKDYINSQQENVSSVIAKIGLGMILIKGLAPLCGVEVSVVDNIWDSRTVGTLHILIFERVSEG